MADIQTVVTQLNDRLLKLEGEAFVLGSIAVTLLNADDEGAARIRRHLEVLEVAVKDEMKRQLDRPTRRYVEAASAYVSSLLANEASAKPSFTVIDGGRSED